MGEGEGGFSEDTCGVTYGLLVTGANATGMRTLGSDIVNIHLPIVVSRDQVCSLVVNGDLGVGHDEYAAWVIAVG